MRLLEWSRGLFAKAKLHIHVALLVILKHEMRPLSTDEYEPGEIFKRRVASLVILK